MPAAYWIGGVRPLLMVSYWADFLLAGRDSRLYHATNICLHAVASALVFYCCAALLEIAGISRRRQLPLTFLVAALFLLHPLQTESVDYISGRSELLAGVCFLAAFLLFIRTSESKFSFRRVLAILALSLAAILSKEQAVVIAPVFLLTDLARFRGCFGARLQKSIRFYACLALFALAGLVLGLRVLEGSASAGFHVAGVTPVQYFLTESRAIPLYVAMTIFPVRQNADWDFSFSKGLFDQGSIFWVCLLVVCSVAAVFRFRRDPWVVYGFFWFLLLLAPTSSMIPLSDAFVERRMYLPLFGLVFALAVMLERLNIRPNTIWIAAAILASIAVAAARNRTEIWTTDFMFWGDVVSKSPTNPRAHLGLGNALLAMGRCSEAVHEYELAEHFARPTSGLYFHADLAFNRGSAFDCDHQLEKSRQSFLEAARFRRDALVYTKLGILAGRMGHVDEAMNDFNQAVYLDPTDAQAFALRGLAFLSIGDTGAARKDFLQALEIDPSNVIATQNMATLNDANRR